VRLDSGVEAAVESRRPIGAAATSPGGMLASCELQRSSFFSGFVRAQGRVRWGSPFGHFFPAAPPAGRGGAYRRVGESQEVWARCGKGEVGGGRRGDAVGPTVPRAYRSGIAGWGRWAGL
jgi:hypothetical protein